MRGKYLETLTWPQAERAIQQTSVVLLPMGARAMQHGLHLPLNYDCLLAEYLSMRVAEQCNVLVLPTLHYGFYPGFQEYPGSVSVASDTCRDTIVDVLMSIADHGARVLYVLSTAAASTEPLQQAQGILEREGLRMDFTDTEAGYAPLRRQVESQPDGNHADEIATSAMLYIAPEVVQMQYARRDIHPDFGGGELTRDPERQRGIFSSSGSYGDPTLATFDKGKLLVEGMVQSHVEHIQRFAPEPRRMAALTLPTGAGFSYEPR